MNNLNITYLSIAQNVCAARVFLNAFNLILESYSNINENSKLKIFDKNLNEVGKLFFDRDKVIIESKYYTGNLNASYYMAKSFSGIDYEEDAICVEWSNSIMFEYASDNNTKLSGKFWIDCSADSKFGIKCLCHPLIKYEDSKIGKLTLLILTDGRIFGVDIVNGNYNEIIDIMPWDELNGFICHDIKDGIRQRGIHAPYHMRAGIFSGGIKYQDKLHIYLKEEKDDKILAFRSEFSSKVETDKKDSAEDIIQKGLLMQEIDSLMFEQIQNLNNMLVIGDTPLLNNLIGICYDEYSDNEVEALLGIKRTTFFYQDGSDNLTDAYFKTGSEIPFISNEYQKRLIKNK